MPHHRIYKYRWIDGRRTHDKPHQIPTLGNLALLEQTPVFGAHRNPLPPGTLTIHPREDS